MSSIKPEDSAMRAAVEQPPTDWMEDLREVVCEFVRMHLSQGLKRAQAAAARALHITPRRVRAWWQREVRLVTHQEAEQIKAARTTLYQEQLARLDTEQALLRARLAALRETQYAVSEVVSPLAGAPMDGSCELEFEAGGSMPGSCS